MRVAIHCPDVLLKQYAIERGRDYGNLVVERNGVLELFEKVEKVVMMQIRKIFVLKVIWQWCIVGAPLIDFCTVSPHLRIQLPSVDIVNNNYLYENCFIWESRDVRILTQMNLWRNGKWITIVYPNTGAFEGTSSDLSHQKSLDWWLPNDGGIHRINGLPFWLGPIYS